MAARLRTAIETGTIPKELLVVGPAGSGKTYPFASLYHTLARDYPKLRILFLRATRVSMTESMLVTFEQEILPADNCEYIAAGAQRSHRKSYRYPNGSEIVVAGLDRNETKVLSTAWDIVFWNEAIEAKKEAWETLASRMGRPGRDKRFGWLHGDTNPGSPDHWLKQRCDAGNAVMWDTTHKANPAMWDGLNWTEAGRSYRSQLEKLTGPRRKRLLEGLWVQGEGIWFDTFDPDIHVSAEKAEYDPKGKVYLAFDPGYCTGAVWFQVHEFGPKVTVNVFGDFYAEGPYPDANAQALLDKARQLGIKKHTKIFVDSAGDQRNASGPTQTSIYESHGVSPLDRWPSYPGSVNDQLTLVQSFIGGDGTGATPSLFVHPRCVHLLNAFGGYTRAKVGGQWADKPVDPQHPYEEMIDSLRGGLAALFPEGRRPKPNFARVHAGRFM